MVKKKDGSIYCTLRQVGDHVVQDDTNLGFCSPFLRSISIRTTATRRTWRCASPSPWEAGGERRRPGSCLAAQFLGVAATEGCGSSWRRHRTGDDASRWPARIPAGSLPQPLSLKPTPSSSLTHMTAAPFSSGYLRPLPSISASKPGVRNGRRARPATTPRSSSIITTTLPSRRRRPSSTRAAGPPHRRVRGQGRALRKTRRVGIS
jgi:hypothetical protein